MRPAIRVAIGSHLQAAGCTFQEGERVFNLGALLRLLQPADDRMGLAVTADHHSGFLHLTHLLERQIIPGRELAFPIGEKPLHQLVQHHVPPCV